MINDEPKRVWITLLDNGGYRIYENGKCVCNSNSSVGISERIMELIIDTKCKRVVFV